MEHLITLLATKKGILYGFLVGLMKIMNDLRQGKVGIIALATDLIGAIIIGHTSYEVISLTDTAEPFKIIWTFFLAANAFVVVSIFTDKELVKKIIEKYIKKI